MHGDAHSIVYIPCKYTYIFNAPIKRFHFGTNYIFKFDIKWRHFVNEWMCCISKTNVSTNLWKIHQLKSYNGLWTICVNLSNEWTKNFGAQMFWSMVKYEYPLFDIWNEPMRQTMDIKFVFWMTYLFECLTSAFPKPLLVIDLCAFTMNTSNDLYISVENVCHSYWTISL